MKKPQILFIDDELQWSQYIIQHFKNVFEIYMVSNIQSALLILKDNPNIKAVITDWTLRPNQKTTYPVGLDMISAIIRQRPDIAIIICTSMNVSSLLPDYHLGVDLIINRSEIALGDSFVKKVKEIIQHRANHSSLNKSESVDINSETRDALMKEFKKYSHSKEKTISLPGEGNFELIKPLIGFKRDIEKQLEKFEFSKNVFLMMKFRQQNKNLSDFIIENLTNNGFNGVRADANEWNVTHNLYNPIAALYCCKYGIALFDEPEDSQAYSPNVAYELGIMHLQNKNCLILKHGSLPQVPFDLIKDLYTIYEKDLEVKRIISNWLIQIRHFL